MILFLHSLHYYFETDAFSMLNNEQQSLVNIKKCHMMPLTSQCCQPVNTWLCGSFLGKRPVVGSLLMKALSVRSITAIIVTLEPRLYRLGTRRLRRTPHAQLLHKALAVVVSEEREVQSLFEQSLSLQGKLPSISNSEQ
jgi:hypothetical protein